LLVVSGVTSGLLKLQGRSNRLNCELDRMAGREIKGADRTGGKGSRGNDDVSAGGVKRHFEINAGRGVLALRVGVVKAEVL
jgi:hypothetical protein